MNKISALISGLRACFSGILLLQLLAHSGARASEAKRLPFDAMPMAQLRLSGPLGERIHANTKHWLLRAPAANPGMIGMFYQRDRLPKPDLVPWAGEFVGKYLISAVAALRMDPAPELRDAVEDVVKQLIASQAEDGYLGPFPKAARLRGNWDLWGHYHCILGLLMWHEQTNDPGALSACRRAADLVCATFLDTPLRVFDAGSQEMNMAILHALGALHRLTGEPRYWRMMKEIEKDWERAGDYVRTGLNGIEFFATPRPRWESLHDLQGLVELYRISGEESYRTAFMHHWGSIQRWDRRNTGGFSSGEQATGDAFADSPIETCCTVSWMALTLDMLRLTGDSTVADELELSTFNAGIGAQHPSGSWWTYNTPMNGVREASAHSIVFQARAGTPELNCCSVNGPRTLGMLSEWAVMRTLDGLAINYYGPGTFQGKLADNTPIAVEWLTDYPVSERVVIRVEPLATRKFNLRLRIPAWSRETAVRVNNSSFTNVMAGRYLELNRQWRAGDRITLDFDLSPRFVAGQNAAQGKVSIYRGPLLLAYDPRWNELDEAAIPSLDPAKIKDLKATAGRSDSITSPAPWLLCEIPAQGQTLWLCDFASAGSTGTRYQSWFAATNAPPPAPILRFPTSGTPVNPAGILFRWMGPRQPGPDLTEYQLVISRTPDFRSAVLTRKGIGTPSFWLAPERAAGLRSGQLYYWKVTARNTHGATDNEGNPGAFRADDSIPASAPPPAPSARDSQSLPKN